MSLDYEVGQVIRLKVARRLLQLPLVWQAVMLSSEIEVSIRPVVMVTFVDVTFRRFDRQAELMIRLSVYGDSVRLADVHVANDDGDSPFGFSSNAGTASIVRQAVLTYLGVSRRLQAAVDAAVNESTAPDVGTHDPT